jgi:hypothetical protein
LPNDAPLKKIPFSKSTLETIDGAMYQWLRELNLHTTTNSGFEPVDVIWVTAERAYQSKRSKEHRDNAGTVKYPLITIERNSVEKNPTSKGTIWGNVPHERDAKGGAKSITIARQINQDKTGNFVNAETKRKVNQLNFPRKSQKIVYNTYSIPMPVYVDVMYAIKIRTLYQSQMNDLLQPFMTRTQGINYFNVYYENHKYECFIQSDFGLNNNIANLSTEERRYESTVMIKTLGYLIGDGDNQEQPNIVVRENAVNVVIPKERIVFEDELPYKTDHNQGFVGSEKLTKL